MPAAGTARPSQFTTLRCLANIHLHVLRLRKRADANRPFGEHFCVRVGFVAGFAARHPSVDRVGALRFRFPHISPVVGSVYGSSMAAPVIGVGDETRPTLPGQSDAAIRP